MDYNNQSDSSGTDDDLPPSHSNRGTRGGRPSGNGRAAGGSVYSRPQPPTADQQIRKLELDAYTAVLRAFGAQSEVITWAKERLMSDLRKELRVPDEQHRELLGRVAGDEALRQIREWRQVDESGPPPSAAPALLLDPTPSPAVSQSRKKQKTGHVTQVPTPMAGPAPPPPLLKPAPSAAPPVPSPAPSKRGVPVGPRGKKSKGAPVVAANTPKAAAGGPASGRGSNLGRGPAPARAGAASEAAPDPYLGRKVKTRWPEDNTFYEAVIMDFDQEKGKHALVYDMGTAQETWEWVNLKEMSKSDMKWVEGPPISLVNKGASAGPLAPVGRGGGRGMKRGGSGRGASISAAAGRARGGSRGQAAAAAVTPAAQTRSWRGPAGTENGLERKGSRTLQIPVVDPLLKEAENLEEITDIEKLENMKRKAKAQEEALRTALAELGESSEEAESDDGAHGPSSHTRSVDRERVNRSRQDSRDRREETDEEDTAGDGRGEGSDGEPVVGEGGGASDGEQHGAEEGEEDDEDG